MNSVRMMVVAGALSFAAMSAHAQSTTCRGKLVIDAVYQKGLGGGKYEYYLQIRNATDGPLHWRLNFRDLPSGARADSAEVSSGADALAAHSSKTLRFGKGINANINMSSVTVGYDVAGKNITASNCY